MTYGANRVVMAGTTASFDLPVAGYAPQTYPAGSTDRDGNTTYGTTHAFVSLYDVNESGIATLTFSIYFGGPGADTAQAAAMDSKGQLILAGYTNGGELKGLVSGVALQPSDRGGLDGFVA